MDRISLKGNWLLHLAAAAILSAAILLCCGATVSAASNVKCEYIQGNNIDSNDYSTWSSPVSSYLVKNGTGYMRVQGSDEGKISVAYYDSGFNVTSRKTITGELPLFGGFYASGGYYYIVTGKSNTAQSDAAEVYRITKYSSSWVRQGSCSLTGENTCEPFAYGSCRMAMDGNYLLIRTCHTMYADSNGIHHQANVTIEVNTSNMTVTDRYTKIWNENGGYVSHSFNQFIGIDGNHHIVAVDHGDASPRSICLMRYNTNVTTGRFSTDYGVSTTHVVSFAGESGNNTTGASVGAFELIGSNYLIAGNSTARFSNTISGSTRNIFVASSNGGIKWLTSYVEGEETVSTPHMVRINNSKFMVLWSRGDNVNYTFIDASGNSQSSIYSVPGHLSDCAPIYDGSSVVWYTYNNGKEDFYVIPVSSPAQAKVITRTYGHDYKLVSANNGTATIKCSRCGSVTTGSVPASLSVYWKLGSSSSGTYSGSATQHVPYGDSVVYWPFIDDDVDADSDSVFSELEFVPSNTANVIVDTDKETIRFLKPGKYTVTAGPKYNPSVRETYTFYVYKPLKSVSLKLYNEGPLKSGDEVIVSVIPDGGGYMEYYFEIVTPTGIVLNHTQYDMNGIAITANTPGTYTMKVTAYNRSASSEAAVTSAPLKFTVEPSPAESSPASGTESDTGQGASATTKKDTSINQLGKDGTAVGKGASAAVAYKAIRNASSEEGPAGTRYAVLRARSTKQTKTSITLKWRKVTGSVKYVIYGTKCGKSNKMKRICTVSGTSKKITKAAGKKLKKGKYYKFIIVAIDRNNKVISTSKVVHAATKGGKVCNYKKVTVKKSVIRKARKLSKGKTLKLRAKAVKASSKTVKIHRAVRYESSNRKIATVTSKGTVKAKKKGACYIYAYAQNGVYKKIKVIVK